MCKLAVIRYVVLRVAGLLGVLVCTSAITFWLMHLAPGGPFDTGELPLPADAKLALNAAYGLDEPLPRQFLTFLWAAVHGNLGVSFQSPGETVLQVVERAWPVTLQAWDKGKQVVLVANPDYHGPAKGYYEKIVFLVGPFTAQLPAYEKDEIDVLGSGYEFAASAADNAPIKADPVLSKQLHTYTDFATW